MKKFFLIGVAILGSTLLGVNFFLDVQNVSLKTSLKHVEALAENESEDYRYPDRGGRALFCKLYVYRNLTTNVEYSYTEPNKDLAADINYEARTEEGLKDRCPRNGNGCSPFSCQKVPY